VNCNKIMTVVTKEMKHQVEKKKTMTMIPFWKIGKLFWKIKEHFQRKITSSTMMETVPAMTMLLSNITFHYRDFS